MSKTSAAISVYTNALPRFAASSLEPSRARSSRGCRVPGKQRVAVGPRLLVAAQHSKKTYDTSKNAAKADGARNSAGRFVGGLPLNQVFRVGGLGRVARRRVGRWSSGSSRE
jgi:hypothetical protein